MINFELILQKIKKHLSAPKVMLVLKGVNFTICVSV